MLGKNQSKEEQVFFFSVLKMTIGFYCANKAYYFSLLKLLATICSFSNFKQADLGKILFEKVTMRSMYFKHTSQNCIQNTF